MADTTAYEQMLRGETYAAPDQYIMDLQAQAYRKLQHAGNPCRVIRTIAQDNAKAANAA